MANWDEDSAQLRRNLTRVLRRVRDEATRRGIPSVESARHWQADALRGLAVEDTRFMGRFRAHCEWVRIHPFANGNGRTARIWANSILMRYRLPTVVRLRPTPDAGYGSAAEAAMNGQWQPTARVFRRLLVAALGD